MDYSSSSSKGWELPIYEGERQHQHHHQQQREWLSCSTTTSPSPAPKIEILDEDDDQESRGGDAAEASGAKFGVAMIEREHMFDKVVTPSDVGKLNRLVIPKQHAERYFPLDSSSNEKGLLLNFEDRMGKPWRFRYSYWNSSQSYVMTKGWSRFVKEKKLDAGDIVSFQRGVGEEGKDKLFIDWRRRPDHGLLPPPPPTSYHHPYPGGSPFSIHRSVPWSSTTPTFVLRSHPHPQTHPHSQPHPPRGGGGIGWDHGVTTSHLSPMNVMNMVPSHPHLHPHPYPHALLRRGVDTSHNYACGFGNVVTNPYPPPVSTGSLIFLRSSASASSAATNPHNIPYNSSPTSLSGGGDDQGLVHREEGGDEPMVFESVPVVQGKAAAKRLRLFGVNMDCPITHQPHDFDILSSTSASSSTPDHHHHHHNHH